LCQRGSSSIANFTRGGVVINLWVNPSWIWLGEFYILNLSSFGNLGTRVVSRSSTYYSSVHLVNGMSGLVEVERFLRNIHP